MPKKLQAYLSERMVVDGHGCRTALYFGVKAKENQDTVSTLYWLPKLHKNPLKLDVFLILVLAIKEESKVANLDWVDHQARSLLL